VWVARVVDLAALVEDEAIAVAVACANPVRPTFGSVLLISN
jgi:hypothetical protein